MKTHAFDIDGTILTQQGLYNVLERTFKGFNVQEHLTEYNFMACVERLNLNPDKITHDDIYQNNAREILSETPITNGFLEYLNYLKATGQNYLFITARRPSEVKYTEILFDKHGLTDEKGNVIYCGLEYGTESATQNNKAMEDVKIAHLLKAGYNLKDIIIYEDRPETCKSFYKAGSQVYLIDQLYNRQYTPPRGVKRIRDFTEIKLG